ncbi:integrator complex subunit 13-like isoform X2 [Odontomachus brunneus]|uniref:integrator complex subunit 13-like isoform X2 n=1 Tax=Odontomachus brunneus TaxID=486640 RepID=UPI0013F1DEB5|nr:integrator complex subunit 13-like isoform X2 [Odontomachus brunneus]
MYPANHKTVFVLDHTPYFGISSECPLEFDFLKSRGQNLTPLAPICKSLWTTSVEASLEYCRIVWDLFPTGKLIRFVATNHAVYILNSWSLSQQNLQHIRNATAILGVPTKTPEPGKNYSIVYGLHVAISILNECSHIQHEKRTFLNKNTTNLVNRGRIICITSIRDDSNMKSLENIFLNKLTQKNKTALALNHLPIDYCHLVILNIFPNNIEPQITSQGPREISPLLTVEVHSIKASALYFKLLHLILSHYNLASTTVTGIPMKEEQNASSSTNYDIEIFHSSAAHAVILTNPQDSLINTFRCFNEGSEDYETVTLKWCCTPRDCRISEMQNFTAMYRITPVDVNSRPSSCLINFLLNDRLVMLEMTKKTVREYFSLSQDFGNFMRSNMLVPLSTENMNGPVEKMRSRLERYTKYWPITISSTIMLNIKQQCIDPLLEFMVKEKLTAEEVLQCKQVLFSLLQSEAKHESLPLSNIGRDGKGIKREEQYRLLWEEMEIFLKYHANNSAAHMEILECLLDIRSKVKNKMELDQILRELDSFGKEDGVAGRVNVIRATTDSPPASTMLSRKSKSLLDIWMERSASKNPRMELNGRLNSDGLKTELYRNLKKTGKEPILEC